MFKILKRINLCLFDGEGGTPASTEGAKGEATGTNASAAPDNTRRDKADKFSNVVFGKQTEKTNEEEATAYTQSADETAQNALEESRKAYRKLVSGKFKDLYTEDIQNIINRRFKDTKLLEADALKTKPIMEMLSEKYGIDDPELLKEALEGDISLWHEKAEEAGMSDEQYAAVQKIKRENKALLEEAQKRKRGAEVDAQLALWNEEAEKVKEVYPSFDFEAECSNPHFLSLLKVKVPMLHAYRTLHMEELTRSAAAEAEKRVTANVRAKGMRPSENGTATRSAFVVRSDVTRLTKAERAEIARRARRGEKIEF